MLAKRAFLSAQSFSFYSGLTVHTVNTMIDSGEIKSFRFGRRRLIPVAELNRFALQLELFDDESGQQLISSSTTHRKQVGR